MLLSVAMVNGLQWCRRWRRSDLTPPGSSPMAADPVLVAFDVWPKSSLLVSGFPLRLENLENEYGHGTLKICQKSWNYSNFAPKFWSPLRN